MIVALDHYTPNPAFMCNSADCVTSIDFKLENFVAQLFTSTWAREGDQHAWISFCSILRT
jgi:hypothetical protein